MDFVNYQESCKAFARYPASDKVFYTALGLVGEAGEIANKVKKIIRDDGRAVTDEKRTDLAAEIGDVLWYCAALATDLEVSLGDIAQGNIDKLQSRADRDVLAGSGDKR